MLSRKLSSFSQIQKPALHISFVDKAIPECISLRSVEDKSKMADDVRNILINTNTVLKELI